MKEFYTDYRLFGEGGESATAAESGGDNGTNATNITDENEFDSFINSHKEEYKARVESLINDRLKRERARTNSIKAEYDNAKPVLDLLKSRYKADDYEQLQKSIENDNALWEQEANSLGMEVEQYKDYIRTKNENTQLKAAQQEAIRQRGEEEFLNRVYNQAVAYRAENENFDLRAELNSNPNFINLLQGGVDVKTAYQACHINDIVNNAQQAAAAAATAEMAKNIQSRNGVPAEAGLSNGATVDENIDLSTLSDEEFFRRYERLRKKGNL